ncbi:peptidoglycan-binding domain-containing protein [Desulfosporosinus metallidurans]|uniref:Peptidoglycan-binding protein n=1 Tax=Desulfosporosinus metallidurans TaxID=1888891 RepID=A0A1Q8QIG9_9FIRM|nr:peptidoglycan-binding protein [Desulfosporosinus metallidurans]
MNHKGHSLCPVLRESGSGAAVRDLQIRLTVAGFNPGKIDGVFGPLTKAAVLAFQKSKNLVQDGIVGIKTWSALGANCNKTPMKQCPTLVQGNTGPAVVKLQELLRTYGFYSGMLDGIFGPITRAAVLAYQMSMNLVPDGIVGIKTWTALGVNCI